MRQLHVVMIISAFHPVIGGGERQAQRLARGLERRGHQVTVLTRRLLPNTQHEEFLEGVRVVRVAGNGRWSFAAAALLWIARNKSIIDILHAHQSLAPLLIGALASRMFSIPVVCSPMTAVPELNWVNSSGWRRRLYRITCKWMAKSDEIAKILETYAPGRVAEVPNGVDDTVFVPAIDHTFSIPAVVFVGRLLPPKRVDVLLEAVAHIRQPFRLLVVGEGPHRKDWEQQALRLELSNVEFLGNRQDIVSILQSAEIFVLPSDAEGMPNALLEAMGCGLACVASAVGAVSDLLGDQAGRLVHPNTPEAWATTLEQLLSDEHARRTLGSRARSRVVERYSIAQVVKRVEDLYYDELNVEG